MILTKIPNPIAPSSLFNIHIFTFRFANMFQYLTTTSTFAEDVSLSVSSAVKRMRPRDKEPFDRKKSTLASVVVEDGGGGGDDSRESGDREERGRKMVDLDAYGAYAVRELRNHPRSRGSVDEREEEGLCSASKLFCWSMPASDGSIRLDESNVERISVSEVVESQGRSH